MDGIVTTTSTCMKNVHYLFPLEECNWIYVYEWCQKPDDGGYIVTMITLTKFPDGAKLSICLNSRCV